MVQAGSARGWTPKRSVHLHPTPGLASRPLSRGEGVPRTGRRLIPPRAPAAGPSVETLRPWFQLAPFLHGLIRFPAPKEGRSHDHWDAGPGFLPLPAIFVFKMPLNLGQPGAALRGGRGDQKPGMNYSRGCSLKKP